MKRALLVVSLVAAALLAAGCSSDMTLTYHRVPLGAEDRNLYVLVAKDEDMGENPIALLERLKRRHDEALHVVVGSIAGHSFAAIDSGGGSLIVTKDGRGSPEVTPLLREVERRLATASDDDARKDLAAAKQILESLPHGSSGSPSAPVR
ncbi:MAG: hypothetical protein ACAI25_16935 [Planctomycetota bacterium]